MNISNGIEFTFLRIAVAALLVIHGVARITLGIVDDFGGFLSLIGFPFGPFIAWSITVFEIGGGILLASGRFVRIISLVFSIHLLMGIILVHAQEGWFVVGAGRNGMEYSVLLICVFVFLFLHKQTRATEKDKSD